jgi:L-asparaginase II
VLAEVVRSGTVEAVHDGVVVVVDRDRLVAVAGDVDRPFHLRSAAKPFQATVALELGLDLPAEHLAVACGSHDADPIHVAMVLRMLADGGLSESDLRCPPAWPLGGPARRRALARGHGGPRRVWHDCSGKHAAMVRVAAARGWDVAGYRDPSHPVQTAVAGVLSDTMGGSFGPAGVDGCGVPVFPATATAMARAFAALTTGRRFERVVEAMHRHPALVSGTGNLDTLVATWSGGVAKRGAEGCLGIAMPGGVGIAVKCWDGSDRPLGPVVMRVLEHLGLAHEGIRRGLEGITAPPVLGGGAPVGAVRPLVRLHRP